jgi:hypothetical protein
LIPAAFSCDEAIGGAAQFFSWLLAVEGRPRQIACCYLQS